MCLYGSSSAGVRRPNALEQMKGEQVQSRRGEEGLRRAWAALNERAAFLPHVKVKHTIHPELQSIFTPVDALNQRAR